MSIPVLLFEISFWNILGWPESSFVCKHPDKLFGQPSILALYFPRTYLWDLENPESGMQVLNCCAWDWGSVKEKTRKE